MKNPFLKYLVKESKEDIFHSSTYGKAQSSEKMGTTSVTPFSQRLLLNNDRKVVKKYDDSRLVNDPLKNANGVKRYSAGNDKFLNKNSDSGPKNAR